MARIRQIVDTTSPSLLLRIRDRSDADAWRTFDALYRPMLYRCALAHGLGHDNAEDIAQQCMTAVADHIGEFAYDPQKGRFKSWLRTLVNNRVRSFLRERRDRQAGSADLAKLEQQDPGPDAAFETIWLQEHLWHCLRAVQAEVDDTTYRAFVGYVVEQRPIERVCEELNLKANNVYTIKWRLTERIAAKIRELGVE